VEHEIALRAAPGHRAAVNLDPIALGLHTRARLAHDGAVDAHRARLHQGIAVAA